MSRSTNLRRNPDGIYFLHAKVGGRLIRRSLDTDIEKEAITRRDFQLALEREKAGKRMRTRATMGGLLEAFLERSKAHQSNKPRTKDFHVEVVVMLRRRWPGIDDLSAAKVTPEMCASFFKGQSSLSATRFNGMLQVLRAVFADAIVIGAVGRDPTAGIERKSPKLKPERVPSSEDFKRLLAFLDESRGRGVWLVKFLAYSGARITEAKKVEWADVDFVKGQIRFRAENTKSGKERYVPMVPEMRKLLEEMRESSEGRRVLPIGDAKDVLRRACAKLSIKRFSHHDLRHMFATCCIESGVDIPTVSRWLGHQDGGALAMRQYGHLRDDHSQEQAKRVKF